MDMDADLNETVLPTEGQIPPEDAGVTKQKNTKSAYNRTGLSILTLYGATNIIGSLIAVIIIIPLVLSALAGLDFAAEGEELLETILFRLRESDSISIALMALVIGTAAGEGIGILLQRLVIKAIPAAPIAKRRLRFSEFGLYLFAALCLWGIGVYAGNLPALFGISSILDVSFEGMSTAASVVFLVYSVLGAPVLEELAFRKILLDKLHGYGEVTAALTSAFLFGLMHGNSGQFFLAFNVGLLFAVIYMKTGNVLYTMLLHGIINLIGSASEILCLVGIETVGGVDFDTALWVFLAVLAVGGIPVLLVGRKSELFSLTRSDCPELHKAMLANAGMILFPVLVGMSAISIDFISFVSNLLDNQGAKSCLCLVPTLLYVAAIAVFFRYSGRKTAAAPADNGETVNPENP